MKAGEKQELYFFGDGDGSGPILDQVGEGPTQNADDLPDELLEVMTERPEVFYEHVDVEEKKW